MTTIRTYRATLMRGGQILVFAAAILGVTKVTLEFAPVTSGSTAAFSFIIIVLLSAFCGELPVAIITSCVATLCYDYFYLQPVGTFAVSAVADGLSLAAFLLASVIISRLTASAARHAAEIRASNKALIEMKELGEWMLSMPDDQLTLSGIARETLRIFALEYCSIHVYGEGKWHHATGAATAEVPREIEDRLKLSQDHATTVMELAEEGSLGVRYAQINTGRAPLALLAVKSSTLPADFLGPIVALIGIQLAAMMKDPHFRG